MSLSVESLLEDCRWELMPFASFEEQLNAIPAGQTITITASPQKELVETVDLAIETKTSKPYDVVPHLSARAVRDRDELDTFAGRLEEASITDIFVPGGDLKEPVGEFTSAYELLVALEDLDYAFDEVGITGYPEGHPIIADETLAEAMAAKEQYSTYIVTQICYDADAVINWIEAIRSDGIALPIHVGIPGVMNYQKLIGISARVGVGDSIKFVRKTSGILDMIKRVLGSRGVYRPDELVEGIAPFATQDQYSIAGLHLYTFNRAIDTVAWREGYL